MKHSTLLLRVGFFLAISSGGAGAGAEERVSVLVLPFDAASPDVQWAGRAVGQNLVAELSAIPTVSAIAGAKVATSPEDAASIARPMGAQFVVFGGVQAVEREVRVTGFVVDVAGSQTVGVLKATGAAREAFALQDEVAAQAKAALPVPAAAAAGAALDAAPAVTRPATAGATTTTAPAGGGGYANRIERGIARIEQGNDRVRELEAEVERLNARLRELERDNERNPPPLPPYLGVNYQDDFYYDYPYPYFGNLYYSPFFSFVPINKPGHHHGHHHHAAHHHRGHFHGGHGGSGVGVRGSFNRGNVSGGFRAGGGARAVGGGVRGGGGMRAGGGARAGR